MANQDNRFPYTGTNSKEPTSQQHTTDSFQASNWPSSQFWGNHGASTLNNRDSSSLRGQDDSFTNTQQTSAAYRPSSDTSGIWAQSSTHWNVADNNAVLRRAAPSPTPARRRDGTNDLSNGLSSNAHRFAVGQTGPFPNGRPMANGTSTEANNKSLNYLSSMHENAVEGSMDSDNLASSFATFGIDNDAHAPRMRTSLDSSNAFASTSAAVSVTGSTSSTSAAPGSANGLNNKGTSGLPSFGSFAPVAPSYHGHSHRPSLQASTAFSSPGPSANAVPYHRNSQPDDFNAQNMIHMMRRAQADQHGAESTMHAAAAGYGVDMSAYPQASGGASFQLNPVTAPWDARFNQTRPDAFNLGRMSATAAAAATHRTDMMSGNQGNPSRQATPAQLLGENAADFWRGSHGTQRMLFGIPESTLDGINALFDRGRRRQPMDPLLKFANASMHAQMLGISLEEFGNQLPYFQHLDPFRPPLDPMQHIDVPIGHHMNRPYPSSTLRDKDPARSLRSPLLREFLEIKPPRKFELKDIFDHVVEFSGDQHGSRFIQTKLETANSDEKDRVFQEISTDAVALMKDVFGNYVVQKFFEYGNQVQKKYLAEQMRGKMVDLSTQCYSCRVVQKALQNILYEQKLLLVKELESTILRTIKDPNGNHVVQKVVELLPRQDTNFVVEALRGKVRELSYHNFGCRIVQKVYDRGSKADRDMILAEVRDHTQELSMDQFGNYVVQKIIETDEPSQRAEIINRVIDNLEPMCKQKYASNVVETCIQHGTREDRARIRKEVDGVRSDGSRLVQHMIKDQYANYVLQKLLKALDGEERRLFIDSLSTEVEMLKQTSTGRQNATIDRLADELSKAKDSNGSGTVSSYAGSTTAMSPQFQASHESTPPLTNAPNSPESTNPPSVSSGPTEMTAAAKPSEAVVGTPMIALSSDVTPH